MDYWGYFQPCRLSPGACYFEDPILHGIVVHGNNNNLDCTNSILRSYLPSTGSKYCKPEKIDELEYKAKESLVGKNSDERGPKMYEYKGSNSLLAGCNMRSSPIPVASSLGSYGSSGRDLYYRSARSLSTSPMSTIGSCAANIQHPCRTSSEMPLLTEDGDSSLVPLLGSLSSSHAARPLGIKNTRCVVSSAASFVGLYVLQLSVNGVFDANLIPVGRKLLQHEALESFHGEHVGSGGIGSFLGWAMAGI